MANDINILIASVRNYLDITWDDPAADEKIKGIIERGMKYLDRVSGQNPDYEKEGPHRQLLFDYCRYVRSSAFETFVTNFLHELNALQMDGRVAQYGEATDI